MGARPPYPFVDVEWHDAHSPEATAVYDAAALEDVHGSVTVVTRGWLLREDATGVTLAGEWVGGTEFRNLTFILRSMIHALTPLPERRGRKEPLTPPAKSSILPPG